MISLAGALALTLALGLVFQTIQRTPPSDHPFIPATWSSQTLDAVVIKGGALHVEMKKTAGTWSLVSQGDTLPVRASRVEDLLKSLAELRSLRLAARTAAGWGELKIDDQAATRIDMQAGKQAISLWFGGQSSDGREQYVREAASPAVYAVKAGVAFWLQQDTAYWLDRRLWPENLKEVDLIGITCQSVKNGTLKLVKETKNGIDSWTPTGGSGSVQKDRLASWVQNLLSIEGDDVLPLDAEKVPATYGLSLNITLATKDGGSLPVFVYAPASTDGKWLLVPRFDSRRLSGQGRAIAVSVPEWKLQRSVIGE
jgi:hypothetical protein